MHTGSASVNHAPHELEGVQDAAETGLGICHDRGEIIDVSGIARIDAFLPLDLVCTRERIIDALNHFGHRIDGIQGLIRVHGHARVVVGRYLPTGQVDRLHARLYLLDRLAARQRTQTVDIVLAKLGLGTAVNEVPKLLGAAARQSVFAFDRATQTHDILSTVGAADTSPTGVVRPRVFKTADLFLAVVISCCHGLLHWAYK